MIKFNVKASVFAVAMFMLPAAQAAGFDVSAKYSTTCAICHASGVAGAPKMGDKAAWDKRLLLGMDALVASVKKGKGAMPPNGMCTDCNDEQLKALINHMVK